MGAKKLYGFHWDCGRMGDIEGLFVANEDDIKKAIGKDVYFGEILGKHSEIYGTLEEKDLTVKSEDTAFIEKLVEVIGSEHISGHNPLHKLRGNDEDEDDPEASR